jgi:hypothetical protein
MITDTPMAAERARQKAAERALKAVSRAWGARRGPEDLKEALPLAYAKLEAAREALSATWAEALAGRATHEQFKAALQEWACASLAGAAALKAVR